MPKKNPFLTSPLQGYDRFLAEMKRTQSPDRPYGTPKDMPLFQKLQAFGMTGIPGVSDVAGLAGDAMMFKKDPSSRTPANVGLAALGVLPFFPPAGITKKLTGKVLRVRPKKFARDTLEMGGVRGQKASIQVFKNPTVKDLKRAQSKSGFRHFRDADGNIYAWRADEAIHDQLYDSLKVEPRNPASDVILDADQMPEYYKEIHEADIADYLDDPSYADKPVSRGGFE